MRTDVIVVGAGTVGAAIAFGLVERGLKVVVLDGDDGDNRAATANFGLIWLQGKGLRMPEYQRLSRDSVDLWPAFNDRLTAILETPLDYRHDGGLTFCLGDAAFEKRRGDLERLHNVLGGDPDWEMVDRAALEKLLPGVALGSEVTGASFGRLDGQINPLKLLAGLLTAVRRLGGVVRHGQHVDDIGAGANGFEVRCGGERYQADRIVVAAGLGSVQLARRLGIDVALRPQRGQIQVTERIEPLLPLPTINVRQTAEGTVMIGSTQEETGFDDGTTVDAMARLSGSAMRVLPDLKDVRLVRQWAGLRVMTPDGYPVYAESAAHPGAFVALCHSGVTLAPLHADLVADAVAKAGLPESLAPFRIDRFHVPHAA